MKFIKSKRFFVIIFSLLLLFFLVVELFGLYMPWYESGYPIRTGIGIIRLELFNDEIITITPGDEDMDGKQLISKGEESEDNLIEYLQEKDWEFLDQYGAAYSFEKNGTNLTVEINQLTTDYIKFEFYS